MEFTLKSAMDALAQIIEFEPMTPNGQLKPGWKYSQHPALSLTELQASP